MDMSCSVVIEDYVTAVVISDENSCSVVIEDNVTAVVLSN